MILLFATGNHGSATPAIPVATGIFAFGYLAAWAGFSLVAVILQWGFELTVVSFHRRSSRPM